MNCEAAAGTVAEATRGEEERFIATLDQGLPILTDMLRRFERQDNIRSRERTFLNCMIPMAFRWI